MPYEIPQNLKYVERIAFGLTFWQLFWLALFGGLAGVLNSLILGFVRPLLEFAKVFITVNIDPNHFVNLWQVVVGIISAFYLLLFFVVGLKFLFGCYDAAQRSEAKEWFKKTVLLILCVNASLLLYSLLLGLSSAISLTLWNSQLESLFLLENVTVSSLLWLGLLSLFVFLAVVTLALRQIFLIVGVMLFPIGLFLFFIPPLKSYGSVILNVLGVAAFLNVVDVIVLIAVQLFAIEFNSLPDISLFSLSLGFLLVFLVNLSLIGIAVKKGLSSVGVNVNVVQVAKSVAGVAV